MNSCFQAKWLLPSVPCMYQGSQCTSLAPFSERIRLMSVEGCKLGVATMLLSLKQTPHNFEVFPGLQVT